MKRKRSVLAVAVTILLGIALSVKAGAQSPAPANPYSGDFWSRSTLTGDWGGVRNDLAKKGVTFDLSLTQVYQGIVGGGKEELWKYGGRGDLTINVDTRILKVSRTIADLEGRESVEEPHVAEAIQYRVLDKRVMV